MSILIKGMEMPKNCWECPFRKFWDDEDQCLAKKNFWVKGNKIPPVCPLVELPPHGDLIDKRMLINDISNNAFANADVNCKEEYDFWNRVWEYIRKIPVVIESEE